ncbi:MAG: Molybdopterin molybdenumtransferase [Deltaproteobacteria bacterium ADurb.Bin151]|jgi:molybdenum cofactor synthesis domain-containing protein|nr:molybdopterin biosynthesis protein [Smithella sp.]OQB55133.1 MAG: Molybdopterin molybdenumtransferase [Deltaproteobacteria bacterium ADurb.Bin151]HOG81651.1 molybdopterin biosynthesis protein [Smithellaceae bacterium]HOQ40929.1 molybdopterin biosynthesis protein [Smithellaceae bacterium]HPL65461.1 molybdopterin biosynthesis protein [Smithellaceae bacterium]
MKRNVYLAMKGLPEAREIFLRTWREKKTISERIDTEDALGRVTSGPVYAGVSAPTYHSAAMDGIAVRAERTYGATEQSPIILKTGEDALWINTGHALPEGYNAVIMVEKIHELDGSHIEIMQPAYPWQNIRKVGEDIVATQLLFPQNHIIRSYDMGSLVAAGVFKVMVRKKPGVIIIPTGTEIVSHKDITDFSQLKSNRIIDSNSVTLAGLVREAHAEPRVLDITADEEGAIRDVILTAANSDADLILINAGSSAGSKDYTAGVLAQIGEVLVHGVAMMPGKPTILARVNGKPVIGIPGYPVSAILSFEQFALPLLLHLQGFTQPGNRSIKVSASRAIPSKLGTEEFVRVNIGKVREQCIATPLSRSAGSITTLTRAEGIVRIPPSSEGIAQDEEIEAELLVEEEDLKNTIVVIGSHDIAIDVIADEVRMKTGRNIRISSGNVGSLGGLIAIKKGICHFAGSHLLDTQTGEYNVSYIKRYLKGVRISLFHLVLREQGLIIPKNNPKGIRGIADLTRDDVSYVNRQAGSGTRILFDYNLARQGIKPESVKGYDHEEFTHMSVAVDVLSGAADCGMAIYAAAKALDLDFIPMDREQYDLVIPSEFLEDPNIRAVLDTIRSQRFRDRVREFGGYDPSKSGELAMEFNP